MTTTVRIVVREDSAEFHGVTADVTLPGDGSPEQFVQALKLAMAQAGKNLPMVWRGVRATDVVQVAVTAPA